MACNVSVFCFRQGCKIQTKVYEMLFTNFLSDMFEGDTVGLLTGVSTKKEYVTMGVVHRFITLELTNHTCSALKHNGKVEVALFDEYVDKFIEFLSSSAHMRPVVVVQLAVAGPVGGILFELLDATRIMFNPSIAEVSEFHKKIALHGLDNAGAIACLPGQGYFSIVWAKVMAIVDRASWWVLHCKCGAVLSVINDLYRCYMCNKRVVNPVPKYRLRLHVADGQDATHFVLLDDEVRYLVRKSCGVLIDEVQLSMVSCYLLIL
ncbi:Nucleic acid-binding, OB-fold [Sesbania bispinosa]|nr:Nucleic acid-binding, OB-fold [Sesbania bispinosa]